MRVISVQTVSTASVRKGAMTRRRAPTATLFSLQNEERRVQSHRFSGRLAYGEGISERKPASKIDQHRRRSTSGRCWAAADRSSAAKRDSLRVTPLADEKKVRSFTAWDDVYAWSPDSGVVQNGRSERRFRSLCGSRDTDLTCPKCCILDVLDVQHESLGKHR